MRTKKEIEKYLDSEQTAYFRLFRVAIEVLLDIRDLLARPGVQNDYGQAKDEINLKV